VGSPSRRRSNSSSSSDRDVLEHLRLLVDPVPWDAKALREVELEQADDGAEPRARPAGHPRSAENAVIRLMLDEPELTEPA